MLADILGEVVDSFVTLRRTETLSMASLQSIKLYRNTVGFYVIRHSARKIRVLAQFTGFHEVISRIKATNPGLEVEGI